MKIKEIAYAKRSASRNLLDVYYSGEGEKRPVIFFIHGGSWMTGGKEMYTKLGANFHSKGFVCVIINYRLFPSTDVYGMVEDCLDAFDWCKKNIVGFGGDERKIYLTGHSAGGHLAAVTGLRQEGAIANVAGFVLADAFGLSAYYYLTMHGALIPENMIELFGKEKSKWPGAAPDKLLKKDLPPFLILTGAKTYPFLYFDNTYFADLLKQNGTEAEQHFIPSASHMQMIYEFEKASSPVYTHILRWIGKLRATTT